MLKLSALSLILTALAGSVFHEAGRIRNVQPSGDRPDTSAVFTLPLHLTPNLQTAAIREVDIQPKQAHKGARLKVGRLVCGDWTPLRGVPNEGLSNGWFYGRVKRCEEM